MRAPDALFVFIKISYKIFHNGFTLIKRIRYIGVSLLFPCRRYVEFHINQCYFGARSGFSAEVSSSGRNTFCCVAGKWGNCGIKTFAAQVKAGDAQIHREMLKTPQLQSK